MKLKQLIKDLNYERLENLTDCRIKGISCNSQEVRPGYLFVAVRGQSLDGHEYANHAVEKGAAAIIAQRNLRLKKKAAKIIVKDSSAALACVSAAFFNHPAKRLKVIGITGTNGKTTVSYLIERILACAGYPAGVTGTVNYRVGEKLYQAVNTTPQAVILQSFLRKVVLAKVKYAIIEVSSHALSQHRVDSLDFSSAIFTNLSREHLDYHGSLTNYFSCKLSLFRKLTPRAWAIVNLDQPYGRKIIKKIKSRLITYGIDRPAQIRARDLRLSIEKSCFRVVTPGGNIDIESPLIGRHNVYNILAATSAAFVEGIDFSHIKKGIKTCSFVPGRLQRIDCGQNFDLFVDYAHTEDALAQILNTFRDVSKRRIILVFGCGGDRDKAKRPKMGKAATGGSDFVFITSDNPRSEDPNQIISDIVRGIAKGKNNYKVILDRYQAIVQALSYAQAEDIVVIAGKGHESTQVFADKVVSFNDREVAEKILLNTKTRY